MLPLPQSRRGNRHVTALHGNGKGEGLTTGPAHTHRIPRPILAGLSLRAAAAQLQIRPMAVQRAQKKALAALRQQLVGAG
jgi:hypothetical protein